MNAASGAFCDAVIFGVEGDVTQAQAKLPQALTRLRARVQLAIEALEQEP
jgi:hypothetical protein